MCSGREHGERPCWGAWETAATTAVFSVPGLMVLRTGWGPYPAFHYGAADWVIAGTGIVAALALTFAARGLAGTRLFVSTGLVVGFAWIISDWVVLREGSLARVYKPLVLATLVAHYNLAPFVLFAAARRARGHMSDAAGAGIRRRIWWVVGAVGALDLAPVVYALAPRESRPVIFLGWVTACVLAGGILAAVAAAEMAKFVSRDGAPKAEGERPP